MARRKKTTEVKGDMTPMIDMVFQLLIFFILTLNIVDPEGDFYLRLPMPGAAQASESDIVPDVMRIVLISDTKGDLTGLTVDNVQSRMRTSLTRMKTICGNVFVPRWGMLPENRRISKLSLAGEAPVRPV